MTPQQPQPIETAYKVTEGDLQGFERLLGRKSNLIEAIRLNPISRPHISSTETSGKYVCSPNCDFFGDCSALDKRACRKDQKQHEHDTAIRNETLNDALTALNVAIANRSFVDTDGDYHQCPALTKGEIRDTINSLRSTKETSP